MRAIAIVSLGVCLLSSVFAKPPLVLNYQDNDGQYNFGYADPLSMRTESRTGDGVTRGAYSYYDQNGAIQTTEYEAGKDIGFRVKATNLPEAPLPVDETIEVKNAREKHLQLLAEATRLEEEEKSRLSQVNEAKTVSASSTPEALAIPETKSALNPQEIAATQIIPSFDVRAQIPEARSIPSASLQENIKSKKNSEPISQTIPALPLQQQSQENTANLRTQPLSPELPKPESLSQQAVITKQQDIFSKDLSNQGPLLVPNVLPEQRAFAADNPFLIPFLGQGFSFESALPQQRGLLNQQGQEKITAENINSELPAAATQSRISEQSAISKESIQNGQRAFPVSGIQGPPGLPIQNDQLALPKSGIQGPSGIQIPDSFSNRAFAPSEISKDSIQNDQRALIGSGIRGPPGFQFPHIFSARAFAPSEISKESIQNGQRAFPGSGIQGPSGLPIQNDQLALPKSGIQGPPGIQIPDSFSNHAFAPSEISKDSIQNDQRALTGSGIRGPPGFQFPHLFSARAFAPSEISKESIQNGQRVPGIQGPSGLQIQNDQLALPRSGQQGFPVQDPQVQQRTASAQHAVSNLQGSPTLNTHPAQSEILRQPAFPEQRTLLAQGGLSNSQIFPSANGFFGEGFLDQNTLLRQQGFLAQQGFSEHQSGSTQNIISKQQPSQNIASQQQISQQEITSRQNTILQQRQGSISQQGASGHQFIQPLSAILEQQSIARQSAGSEQQVIPQLNPSSGQQLVQQQKAKCTHFETKTIPKQDAPSEQQGIDQQSGIATQQAISNQNVISKQAVLQQSAISEPQLIQPQSSILEQQAIPSKLPQIPSIQQFIQQQNAILEQGALSNQFAGLGQQPILPPISEQQFIEIQRSIQNHNLQSEQQAVPQLQSIHGQQLIPQQGLASEQQITSRNNVIGEEKKSAQNIAIPEQQAISQQNILLNQQAISRQAEFPAQPLLLGQPSAISGQQTIDQSQDGIARQSIVGPQSKPIQAAVPEQRGVPQNLTPIQGSLPQGFPEHLDQTHLQAESSDIASIRVPEPTSSSSAMPYESVKYTPEVLAAREAHFRAYAIAARLAEESDRNPEILMQLLKGSAGKIAEAESKDNQLVNVEVSRSAISSTATPIIENLSTKSAEQILEKLPEVLPKVAEQRIEPLMSASAPAVDARKIDSAEKVQPFTLPNGIEQPKVRTGLTPASTSLRVQDTRLPTLDEFQQSKLKEALALARVTSLKVTEDKQMTKKFDQPLLIVKAFGSDQIPSMQQHASKNWAIQYMRL